ncbi:MAG: hypothetical protein ACC651_10615 [Candidatus Scalindua sp.]
MSIKSYEEKEIRKAILKKVKPKINPGKHGKGYIYIGKKLEAKVQIPNEHKKIMHQSKSKFIARALKLNDENFNRLIDCSLKGPEYYTILTRAVS